MGEISGRRRRSTRRQCTRTHVYALLPAYPLTHELTYSLTHSHLATPTHAAHLRAAQGARGRAPPRRARARALLLRACRAASGRRGAERAEQLTGPRTRLAAGVGVCCGWRGHRAPRRAKLSLAVPGLAPPPSKTKRRVPAMKNGILQMSVISTPPCFCVFCPPLSPRKSETVAGFAPVHPPLSVGRSENRQPLWSRVARLSPRGAPLENRRASSGRVFRRQ